MVSVTHSSTAVGTNRADSDVSVNAWNAAHTITGLGTAAEANTADLITKAEGAANTGFTLIKYKRSEVNTYARTGAQLKTLGADDSDGISLLHWLDPSLDDEFLAGTNVTALDTPISNALTDFATLRATSGRAQKMTIPSLELLISGGVNFNVDDLVVFGKGARIRSTKATSGYVARFEGDNTEIHGLKIYSEGALDNLYAEVVGTDVKLLNGFEFEKLAGRSGTTLYVRDNADGFRMHHSGVRGGNGINCFNAGDLEWSHAWVVVESVGGDDGIAFKADAREVFDNRILHTYFENAAAMLSIGTGVGMPGANDSSYSRGVYRTKLIGCYGRNCARIAYLKPAGQDGTIGDSRDFRDGTVADTEISSNTLEDLTGAKFSSGVEIVPSRGARVLNTYGKNNVVVGRAVDNFAVGGAAHLEVYHYGVAGNMDGTSPAKIDGFSVGIKYSDPQGGLPNGASDPGYPVDGAVRVRLNDTAYGSMDNIDLGGIEAENMQGTMIRVYSGLDNAVRVPKLKGRNINVSASGSVTAINSDSVVHVGPDIDVEMVAGSIFGGTSTYEPMLPKQLAANSLVGSITGGDGVEITCTAAGRALLDDADATAQRTTLGLGTAATAASTDFATPMTEIADYDFSATPVSTYEVNVTGYKELVIVGYDLIHAAAVTRAIQVSVDGGTSWFTTSGNYIRHGANGGANSETSFLTHTTDSASARNFVMRVLDNSGQIPVPVILDTRAMSASFVGSATAINRIRLIGSVAGSGTPDAGNFTAGRLIVYGRTR